MRRHVCCNGVAISTKSTPSISYTPFALPQAQRKRPPQAPRAPRGHSRGAEGLLPQQQRHRRIYPQCRPHITVKHDTEHAVNQAKQTPRPKSVTVGNNRPHKKSTPLPSRPMQKLWDISPPVHAGSPVFPGDTPYSQQWCATIGPGCPVNVSAITLSPHVGAHADAPPSS